MGDFRYRAVSFELGGKGYVTVGQTSNTTKKSTWEYNPATGSWSQKADFGGGNRRVAFGFAIADKGYVGTGRDDSGESGNGVLHNDFWEFDPLANTWTQKANFPGGNRETATAFSIGDFGYAGLGLAGSRKHDFHKYNPATNTWTTLQNINSQYHLYNTAVFTLNGHGYFATGSGWNSAAYTNYTSKELIRYNPETDTWTKLNDFPGSARLYAAAFTVNGAAYLGLGWTGVYKSDIWQYNESADTWTQMGDFPTPGRAWVSSFVIGNKAYVGNGISTGNIHDEFYVWEPSLSTTANIQVKTSFSTTPGTIWLHHNAIYDYSVQIFALNGKLLISSKFENGESTSALKHNLAKGVYIMKIYNLSNGGNETRKILIP